MNLKILIVAQFPLAEHGGGVGRVSRTLAAEFRRRGHECLYLSVERGSSEVPGDPLQLQVPSTPVACSSNIQFLKELIRDREIDVVINQAGFDGEVLDLVTAVNDVCRLYAVHHNCVACLQEHHQSIVEHFLDSCRVPRFLRMPVVYRLLKYRSRKKIGMNFERAARESRRLVLLANSFINELSVFTNRIDERKVSAILNPAPFQADPTAMTEKEDVLLFVGRLENGQKRVDRLLDIWSGISRQHKSWRLEIVGDGPDNDALKSYAEKLDLERVTFNGHQDPVPYYRKAKLLLMTSDFEGFGMVLVEAQAFGCVPIAFECFSSIGEIIENNRSGLIVERGDTRSFVNSLDAAMSDRERLEGMSIHALEAVERFSSKKIAEQWLTLFRECR